MITRLLVANRAEIAARVIRTCRRLGISTVAVHSDADAGLSYVTDADVAVRLPGLTPAETYLRADLLLEAARRTGADAVHPGYGFLSENAGFARAVLEAGLTWVGPDPDTIEAMGSKVRAKELAREAGVPVLSLRDGSFLASSGTEALAPTEDDLPLLVKASAGGGGRGMRVVRALVDLPDAIAAAEAEAASAFGDGTVFVEPYVERGRHVEVQVLLDRHGRGVALGDRDCSIQRRHQKVVEEAPAPDVADEVRAEMHAAALRLAGAAGYVNAGTVELLYDPGTERFWFLEMNTRLQVEHPVTELVHGLDLVEAQLGVAEGGPVPEPRAPEGHAIEVRLYAEDPAEDWQPQSGVLTAFEIEDHEGLRVDAGFAAGDEVTTHYDAMLAKVVAWAPTRPQAARRLAGALERARIHGVTTNRDLLVRILREPAFLEARLGTDFLERTSVVAASAAAAPHQHLLVAGALGLAEDARARRTVQAGIPVGWRNVVSAPQLTRFAGGHEVAWHGTRDGYVVDGLTVLAAGPEQVRLVEGGITATYAVRVDGDAVEVDGPTGHARLVREPRFTDPADAVASGSLLASMPGTVVRVAVEAGQQVEAGQPVLVLEAMKMQHTVAAPTGGTVTEVRVAPGTQVAAGEVLAVVEEEA